MSTQDPRWRDAWRERTAERPSPPPPGCFEAEAIWRAVALEASPAERRALVAHLAGCASCAETWRLAQEFHGPAPARAAAARPRRTFGLGRLALAAASLVAVAGLGWFAVQRGADQVVLRAGGPGVRSLLEDGRPLPRERFLLRWTPGPPGTIYDVEVATTGLKLVTRGVALTTPEFLVPEAALADFAAGTSIAWRVEATLPDGRVVASVTHVNGVR